MLDDQFEDTIGIRTETGTCTLLKNDQNVIGIVIGGGSPHCPCIFILSVVDGGSVALDGTLHSGDEILSINDVHVKGLPKSQVSHHIKMSKTKRIRIGYRRLMIDAENVRSPDIFLKRIKHRVVEVVGSNVADFLGLSRAIICKDPLVQKLAYLHKLSRFYVQFLQLMRKYGCYYAKGSEALFNVHKCFGDTLADIGARDPQKPASLAFTKFGDAHRQIAKIENELLTATFEQSIGKLQNFCTNIIPDLRATVAKYADAKFVYLSYCLRQRELENEEKSESMMTMGECLDRVQTGNYFYRAVLNVRDYYRTKFVEMREDVCQKLELVDKKHIDEMSSVIRQMTETIINTNQQCSTKIEECLQLFPIEADLSNTVSNY